MGRQKPVSHDRQVGRASVERNYSMNADRHVTHYANALLKMTIFTFPLVRPSARPSFRARCTKRGISIR